MGVGAQFNRVKNWIEKEILNNSDLNNEINNILANLKPAGIDDYSLNVTQMQETLSPGDVGSEVLATTLAEELKQLRYQIQQITGEAQWYSPPDTTLEDLNTLFLASVVVPSNRVVGGKIDANRFPIFLDPNGAAASLRLDATTTNLETYINNVRRVFTADITISGLSTAPSSNNTCLVNESGTLLNNQWKTLGESEFLFSRALPIDTIGTEISALNGKFAAFKVGTEYFVAQIDSTNGELKNARRGFFFNSSQASVPREVIANNDVITLLKLAWVFATHDGSTAGLDLTYNQPTVTYASPTSPATGDYWLDLSTGLWKKYSGAGWVTANAVFIGYCAMDSSNCVAARAADLFNAYSEQLSIDLERTSDTDISTKSRGTKVSVAGSQLYFETSKINWSTVSNLDGSIEGRDINYLYITDLGAVYVSATPPYNRKSDLFGYYHPSRPWRAIGHFYADNASKVTGPVSVFGDELYQAVQNELYNGNFDFWQRGTSVTAANTETKYLADRWYCKNSLGTNGVLTFSRQTSILTPHNYAARLLISTAPTAAQVNGCELYQSLSALDSKRLLGRLMSFRAYLGGLNNVTQVGVQLYYRSTEGKVDTAIGTEIVCNVSAAAPYSLAAIEGVKIPTSAVSVGVRIRIVGVSTGNTYDINNGFQVEEAVLHVGENLLPATRRGGSWAAELNACEAFYEKSYNLTTNPAAITIVGSIATVRSGSANGVGVRFGTKKQATPTVVVYSVNTGTADRVYDLTAAADVNASVSSQGMSGFQEGGTLTSDGNVGRFHYTAEAEI